VASVEGLTYLDASTFAATLVVLSFAREDELAKEVELPRPRLAVFFILSNVVKQLV